MLTFIYNLLPNIDLNGLVTNYYEKFEDTKGVIRSHKSDRKHNGQQTNDKRTNNDLQNITEKTKDWDTRTPLITGYINF